MVELVINKQITREGRALIQTYQRMAHEACAPIFWGSEETGVVEDQGTVTFVKLEQQTIAITAAHVAEGLENFLSDGGTACRIGKASFFPPLSFVRHPDPTIDLAIYPVGERFATVAGAKPVSISDWPLKQARDNEVVLLGGFPGMFRMEKNVDIDFGFFFYAGHIDGSVDGKMRVILDVGNSNPLTRNGIIPRFKLGGCSGGPVFRHVDRNLIERIELAGIISEGISDYELFYAHNLSSLTKDGNFQTSR